MPPMPHSSAHLCFANKDYNNEFSEDGKILEVGRSPEIFLSSAPSAPTESIFQQGQKHTISRGGGGKLRGGAYAPPV